MGSEHYCLRWNNHQSNLLGVFSQLLQDESLVDVTLACSEGAPIRAHKVVLSACSSYFQSLFLDHPERHPIVILKDVRFTELQTLVEFMYKGEVNVQYCQLSALLKTAESLKVKGLAEMTNQNTALREPEREPDRLRPHSQPKPSTCDSPLGGSASAHSAANSTTSLHHNSLQSLKRESSAAERCSVSPPKRLQQSSPVPLDLYQRRCPSNSCGSSGGVGGVGSGSGSGDMSSISIGGGGSGGGGGAARTSSNISNNNNSNISSNSNNNNDDPLHQHLLHHHHLQQQQQQHHLVTSPPEDHDRDRPSSPNDDNSSNDPHSIGINMSLSASTAAAAASNSSQQSSTSQSVVVPPVNSSSSTSTAPSASAASVATASSSSSAAIPSDLTNRSPSRSSVGIVDRPSSSGNLPPSSLTHTATSLSSRLASPTPAGSSTSTSGSGGGGSNVGGSGADSMAGPSGLGPVQSVPLSLKKEIDWDRNDEKMSFGSSGGGGGGDLDYRTSHDSETSESPHGGGGGGCGIGGGGGGGGGGSVPSLEGAPAPLYPCVYCGATFPHQSKLTRHILSHSLDSLKYRETVGPHLLHPGHLMKHELPPLAQHFPRPNLLPNLESCLDAQDGSPTAMDMEYAAAAAAAAMSSAGGVGVGGGCSSGNGGIGGSGSVGGGVGGGSSSGLGMGSSSSTNDPNSVVLCKFCGKSFPDVASLITHLPVHTGDRPFKCEFCGKAFKLRHHMKDHCRVHTGERPFRCHMCGKTFSRSTILKAHEKTHFPKYVRKFLSPSPVDTKDELPQ